MSKLNISISSDSCINAIYFGLMLSGYEYSDMGKPDAALELSSQIRSHPGLDNAKRYFKHARQRTCEPYPFWPRAALLESATHFIDARRFKFDKYCDYVNGLPNLTEEERSGDFFSWVKDFPKYINEVKAYSFFQEVDKQIVCMVDKISKDIASEAVRIANILDAMSADIAPNISTLHVILCPLKCIYSADYFARDDTMSVIHGGFLPHSIVHEYMHLIVHPKIMKYRKAILSLAGSRQLDIDQSYFLGHDENGLVNAFEEHIVRKVSGLIFNDCEINIEQLIQRELEG